MNAASSGGSEGAATARDGSASGEAVGRSADASMLGTRGASAGGPDETGRGALGSMIGVTSIDVSAAELGSRLRSSAGIQVRNGSVSEAARRTAPPAAVGCS